MNFFALSVEESFGESAVSIPCVLMWTDEGMNQIPLCESSLYVSSSVFTSIHGYQVVVFEHMNFARALLPCLK